MSMNDVLVWLMTGGSIIAVSWSLERMGWFQTLLPAKKEWTVFGSSVALALAAKAVVTFVPADTLTMLAPWFEIVIGTFSVLFLAKGFHKVDKA